MCKQNVNLISYVYHMFYIDMTVDLQIIILFHCTVGVLKL